MASSRTYMRRRQARSPARHCSVMFQTASSGITATVTSRSAAARCSSSRRMWDRRPPRRPPAARSTARLQPAERAKRRKVTATRAWAAGEKVGSRRGSSPPSAWGLQAQPRSGGGRLLEGSALAFPTAGSASGWLLPAATGRQAAAACPEGTLGWGLGGGAGHAQCRRSVPWSPAPCPTPQPPPYLTAFPSSAALCSPAAPPDTPPPHRALGVLGTKQGRGRQSLLTPTHHLPQAIPAAHPSSTPEHPSWSYTGTETLPAQFWSPPGPGTPFPLPPHLQPGCPAQHRPARPCRGHCSRAAGSPCRGLPHPRRACWQ